MKRKYQNHSGFTLLEVIVTIIVSSILAVLLMQVMRGHVTRSLWPIEKMDQRLAVQDIMDQITADYRRVLISDNQPLVSLQNRINAGGAPGGYWSGSPFATAIQIIDNYCLDLDQSGESNVHATCAHPGDTLLKVTIGVDQLTMTALFAR